MQLLSFKHYLFNPQPHYIDCRIAVIFTFDGSLIELSVRNCVPRSQCGGGFPCSLSLSPARSKPLPQSWWCLVPESPKMGIFPFIPLLHLPSLVILGELICSGRQHKALCTKELQVRTEGGFGVTPSSSSVRAGEGRQQLRSSVHP